MLKEQNCRNLRVSTKVAKSFKKVALLAIILLSFVRGYLKKGGRQAFCCSPRFRTAMLPTPDQAENHRFAVTRAMRRSGGASGGWSKLVIWKGVQTQVYIRKQVKPLLTPHFFRHNYVTLLYEAGVDPLIAMKIVGHTDYQTTANIYTHVRDEMLKKATVNLDEVFGRRVGE